MHSSSRRLRNNPDVASAQAALRQAMENTAAQRGAYFPTLQASFDAQRQHNAVGVLAPTLASGTALFNLYTPQVAVTYVPDVFGANRRQVESLGRGRRGHPLRARCDVSDPHRERGHDRNPGGRIAGPDRRAPSE